MENTEKNEKFDWIKCVAIVAVSLYLLALSFLTICSLVGLLAAKSTEPIVQVRLCFADFNINQDIRLFLLAAVMGVLGSLIYCFSSFVAYVGNKRFHSRWTLWYLLRPFIGLPLAIIVYVALRGGLLTWNAESVNNVNEYGIASICGLVGLFSKQTIEKLKEVFENFFAVPSEKLDDQLAKAPEGNADQKQ